MLSIIELILSFGLFTSILLGVWVFALLSFLPFSSKKIFSSGYDYYDWSFAVNALSILSLVVFCLSGWAQFDVLKQFSFSSYLYGLLGYFVLATVYTCYHWIIPITNAYKEKYQLAKDSFFRINSLKPQLHELSDDDKLRYKKYLIEYGCSVAGKRASQTIFKGPDNQIKISPQWQHLNTLLLRIWIFWPFCLLQYLIGDLVKDALHWIFNLIFHWLKDIVAFVLKFRLSQENSEINSLEKNDE
jgi:hypothetical protein